MGTHNPYVVWLKCKQKSGQLDKAWQNNNKGWGYNHYLQTVSHVHIVSLSLSVICYLEFFYATENLLVTLTFVQQHCTGSFPEDESIVQLYLVDAKSKMMFCQHTDSKTWCQGTIKKCIYCFILETKLIGFCYN